MNFFDDVRLIGKSLASIAVSLAQIAAAMTMTGGPPTGIDVSPGHPHDRPQPPKDKAMTKPKVSLTRSGHGAKAAMAPTKRLKAGDPVVDFQINDNQDDTCTVYGTNSAGDRLDISSVATLSVSSSDTSIISVDPPSGNVFTMHALKQSTPGTPVVIHVTATWNDGSVGPFTFDLPCDVQAGGATGLLVVPGTPTVRP